MRNALSLWLALLPINWQTYYVECSDNKIRTLSLRGGQYTRGALAADPALDKQQSISSNHRSSARVRPRVKVKPPRTFQMGVGVEPVLLYVSVEFEVFGQVQGGW